MAGCILGVFSGRCILGGIFGCALSVLYLAFVAFVVFLWYEGNVRVEVAALGVCSLSYAWRSRGCRDGHCWPLYALALRKDWGIAGGELVACLASDGAGCGTYQHIMIKRYFYIYEKSKLFN